VRGGPLPDDTIGPILQLSIEPLEVPWGRLLALLIVVVAVLARHVVTSVVHLVALVPEVRTRVTLVEVSKQRQETK
jgi:hypothetical protein